MEVESVESILGEIEILISSDDDCTVKCILTKVEIIRKYVDYAVDDSDSEFDASSFPGSCEITEDFGNFRISELQTDPANASESVETEYIIVDEREAMAAMGLPTAFGDKRKNKRNKRKTRIGREDFAKYVLPSLKECKCVQSLESAASAMQKMGYFYNNTTTETTNICENGESIERENQWEDEKQDEKIKIISSTELEKANIQMCFEEDNEHIIITNKQTYDRLSSVENIESHKLVENDCMQTENNKEEDIQDEYARSENVEESCSSEYTSAKSQLDEEGESVDSTNNKKKNKKRFKKPLPKEISEDLGLFKYYLKRYTLFSLYDSGIKMDREAWFSATPESIAKHTAMRLSCDVIVDAFCGTGGNAIQFAKTCQKVIAIDIDPVKIEMAKHNASIYGVLDKIDFIVGDFIQLSGVIKANVVFLSPPWGGPNYKANTVYDLEKCLQPIPVSSLFKLTKEITNNIAMYLPKTSNTKQLLVLAGAGNQVEIEQNYLFDRLTAITAYYGSLIKT